MTFDEIVNKVRDRLNLTSPASVIRVGERVNEVYKEVTASIGLQTSRRVTVNVTIDQNTAGLPDVTIPNVEKVLRIMIRDDNGGLITLSQMTYDSLTQIQTASGTPRSYAVNRIGASEVVVTLDSIPTASTTLICECYDHAEDLVGNQEPYLPSSFHDLLVEGAMAKELRKMEKPELATIAENKYQQRLSDLRMFIAKNAYMDIYQAKPSPLWFREWSARLNL